MSLGGGFQRVQLFQFLGSHFLERRGDGSFFDIDFLAGEVFQLLHRLGQRLEADRLPGENSDDRKAGLFVKGVRDAGSW